MINKIKYSYCDGCANKSMKFDKISDVPYCNHFDMFCKDAIPICIDLEEKEWIHGQEIIRGV